MARGSEQSGEGELLIAGRAADELAGVGGDGSAEIADPVGQRVRPQACHDVVAVEAAEVVDHILDSEVWASHSFPYLSPQLGPAALDWLREHASQG